MTEQDTLPPVRVSGNALRDMTTHLRTWTGWSDVRLTFGETDPKVSPWAMTDPIGREVTANIDLLLLNPNRVLKVINPFRLRQEAVLTGALLHEAGHARYTKWVPRTKEAFENFKHSDGSDVTKGELAFARLLEEPRVEGRMAMGARMVKGADNGAAGLEWTMRACAAHLMPMTELSVDPEQQIMELIESWTLRAGRQVAHANAMGTETPDWVNEFTSLVYNAIVDYLTATGSSTNPISDAGLIMDRLRFMCRCSDDTGTTMIDYARDILGILFPETDDPPTPSAGCGSAGEGGQPEPSEAGDDEPEEGTSGSAGSPESNEQGEGEQEDQSSGSGAQGEESETDQGSGTGDEPTEAQLNATADLQAALEDAEAKAEAETQAEAKAQPTVEKVQGGTGAGSGTTTGLPGGGWRTPTAEERETQRNAAKFLRDLINPTERQKIHLSETPSAQVDGAALAAWKASGQVRDPMFFLRTHREVLPTPPIKIGVLVDTSGSMDEMQGPSALLSWALASAAFDLRNFAGRGAQIESTLIHWGDSARVIQPNGVLLPGLRTVECREYTDAMGDALMLLEEQIPGFFDVSEKPENRLLVQFTDWGLGSQRNLQPMMNRAMEAGVNMLSVMPNYGGRRQLDSVMRACPVHRGRNDIVKYNSLFPEAIWDEASKVLAS